MECCAAWGRRVRYLAGFGLALDGVYDWFRDDGGRIVSGDALFVRRPGGLS